MAEALCGEHERLVKSDTVFDVHGSMCRSAYKSHACDFLSSTEA